jgi:hypothetical protein
MKAIYLNGLDSETASKQSAIKAGGRSGLSKHASLHRTKNSARSFIEKLFSRARVLIYLYKY